MAVTSVHTQQTSDAVQHSYTYRATKALKHESEIRKIREIFVILEQSEASPIIERLDTCCTGAWFERHKETHKVRIRSKRCFIRWCPLCGNARQIYIANSVKAWLEKQKRPRLLTMTIRHQDTDLAQQIDHLYLSFQKLRKRKIFKSNVSGMIWFFQIKRSKLDGKWHPHIHAMIAGKYIPQDKLVTAWKAVTGDSEIIHIKAVDNTQRSSDHIARYAVNPADLDKLELIDACEVVSALKGKRILGATGSARAISFKPESAGDSKLWVPIGSFLYVKQLLEHDGKAFAIMNAYLLDAPLEDGNSLRDLEKKMFEEYIEHERPPPKINTKFFPEIK